eukprot:gnl/TRDRNA2_/TRDRNA2_209822_c0_seq1.p1 gnl/TRDRNA2_/TRDRNA2_209822_c0~~gnl/TRDRNA2_/TRDRNA2_209822_c0_seq1.p1  ORF type:complete len:107 (-),score=5.52 gnl/TRDRNA2_/TRDRNA2_209822_c0_seq1:54-374(-)
MPAQQCDLPPGLDSQPEPPQALHAFAQQTLLDLSKMPSAHLFSSATIRTSNHVLISIHQRTDKFIEPLQRGPSSDVFTDSHSWVQEEYVFLSNPRHIYRNVVGNWW